MVISERLRPLAELLACFDGTLLERTHFYFAGGCRLSFGLGGHRVSRDLDFLCADAKGYREMRIAVRERGYVALFGSRVGSLELPREIRADAYGIRFPVLIGGTTVRVELVREARVPLHQPEHEPWTHAPCLAWVDCYTEKLLANSDRGADPDELSRDLVDLAALRLLHGPIPAESWAAAEAAYGPSVATDLDKHARRFLAGDTYRTRCMVALSVADPALIERGVKLLAGELPSLGTGEGR